MPIDFDDAMAIEALLSAAAAVAFLVPVNAGVQEAGYAGLGVVFGVPPEVSLGVSLVRRGRDIVVGVPILLLWQFIEMRQLRLGAHPVRRIADGRAPSAALRAVTPLRPIRSLVRAPPASFAKADGWSRIAPDTEAPEVRNAQDCFAAGERHRPPIRRFSPWR